MRWEVIIASVVVNVVGFNSKDIADSVGGNIAFALTRYLVECQNTGESKILSPLATSFSSLLIQI